MISYGYSCSFKSGSNKKQRMHFCRFLVLYYDGALERQCKRQSKRGKEMFGFRVGKFLALGIVPDGHSPSLYKQFLLLLLFVFPFNANPSHTFHKKTLKGSFSGSVVCLQTRNQHLSPTAPNLWHFQNQHNTKCQADSLPLWVVLFPIFSPPQPPYLLRRKRENFCPENNNKKSHPDKKRAFLSPCCLGTKVDSSRTNRTNLSRFPSLLQF